jgi:hypothetical protein
MAIDDDFPYAGSNQAANHAEQSGFTRTVGAEQTENEASTDGE